MNYIDVYVYRYIEWLPYRARNVLNFCALNMKLYFSIFQNVSKH